MSMAANVLLCHSKLWNGFSSEVFHEWPRSRQTISKRLDLAFPGVRRAAHVKVVVFSGKGRTGNGISLPARDMVLY